MRLNLGSKLWISEQVWESGCIGCPANVTESKNYLQPKEQGRHRHVCMCAKALQFSSVQSLSHAWLFATPWIAARQASLSITNSQSLLKLMSIESVMPSSHLILCHPLLLLLPIHPSIRLFSSETTLCMRWPKYWSFSFSISPSNGSSYSQFLFHFGLILYMIRSKDPTLFFYPSIYGYIYFYIWIAIYSIEE